MQKMQIMQIMQKMQTMQKMQEKFSLVAIKTLLSLLSLFSLFSLLTLVALLFFCSDNHAAGRKDGSCPGSFYIFLHYDNSFIISSIEQGFCSPDRISLTVGSPLSISSLPTRITKGIFLRLAYSICFFSFKGSG